MATEYRMVVEGRHPDPESTAVAFRPLRYRKGDYGKATKGIEDFEKDRRSGRFDGTWNERAIVYIETREVSKWQRLNMKDATEDAATTSRPDS